MQMFTAPEYALAFVGQFGAVQSACVRLFRNYMHASAPALSSFIDKRIGRLSDAERIQVVQDLASALGAMDRFQEAPPVYSELKTIRDDLSHSTALFPSPDEVWAFRGFPGTIYSVHELSRAYARSKWLAEQVAYIAGRAGFETETGHPLRRESGVLLRDSPPPVEPPTAMFDDPVLWWRAV